ncbi:T-lymphocyte activation antigen CD80, partial [Anomaloglossus baeobatrachus]|uniref:T-lymphocyte activation antigen CD80 n=1 Tax=Anomaloglossus baeobatrachus TaxID=238106 RepID=UPI003F5040DD
VPSGAAQPRQVQAQVGHSVILQCVVPVPKITQWGTLRLFLQRPEPSSNPKVVFSFSNGQEQPGHQDGEYRNRCSLYKDNLTLTLSHISPRDAGEYDCNVFLLKSKGYELEYTGRLLLSTWADYSRPQISVFIERAIHTAVCSSSGGYPRGTVEWITSSELELRNVSQTRADSDPQTLLYNVSGRLTLPQAAPGSVSCCVVAAGRRVCSQKIAPPAPPHYITDTQTHPRKFSKMGMKTIITKERRGSSRLIDPTIEDKLCKRVISRAK